MVTSGPRIFISYAVKDGSNTARSTGPLAVTGGVLAAGYRDGRIRLWRVADKTLAGELIAKEGVTALLALPDGHLAAGMSDGSIRIWRIANQSEVARHDGHKDEITGLHCNVDGELLSCSLDASFRSWDLAKSSSKEIARLDTQWEGSPRAVHFLADGRVAFISDYISSWDDETGVGLWVWDRSSEQKTKVSSAQGFRCLRLLSDGRLALGTGIYANSIWIIDTASGEVIAKLNGHDDAVNSIAELPNGMLASGSSDHSVCLWNLADHQLILRFHVDGQVGSLAVLPDGRLAVGAWDELHWVEILQ